MQVFVKRGLAAHGHGFAFGHDGTFINTMGCIEQPSTITLAKVLHQPFTLFGSQVANGMNALCLKFGFSFGANAVDLATR